MLDFIATKKIGCVEFTLLALAHVQGGDNRQNAGGPLCGVGRYRPDTALRNRGTDRIPVGVRNIRIMPFVGIHCSARRFLLAVNAGDRLTDDFHPVDGIVDCRCVEFHGRYPLASAITAPIVRSTRVILKRFCSVGRASPRSAALAAFAPLFSSRSPEPVRQGL
ncbi:hypothetical protein D3C80_1363260 [compost metagenome]